MTLLTASRSEVNEFAELATARTAKMATIGYPASLVPSPAMKLNPARISIARRIVPMATVPNDNELARRGMVTNDIPAGGFYSSRRGNQLCLELPIGTGIPVYDLCQVALRLTTFPRDAGPVNCVQPRLFCGAYGLCLGQHDSRVERSGVLQEGTPCCHDDDSCRMRARGCLQKAC